MAGVRHHILPRFLLKGFASPVDGAKTFTWVYWKDREPREVSIRDIAVEEHFYGRKGDVNADPVITDQEGELAVLVDNLRTRPDGTEIVDPAVASLVVHLSIRTKHLRDSLLESADALIPYLDLYLSDPLNIENLAIQGLLRPDAPCSRNRRLRRVAVRKAPNFVRRHKAELHLAGRNLILLVKAALPQAIRNGHIKALLSAPIPEPRAEQYRSLHWFVCQSPVPLILGDVCCLFGVSGSERYKSLTDKEDRVEMVSLPLLSDRMLAGTPRPTLPKLDFEALTEAHAIYSRDFFVCSAPSDRMRSLALRLGEGEALFTKEEMTLLLSELLAHKPS